jgi:predicted alpha/beta superfamily hydrolase
MSLENHSASPIEGRIHYLTTQSAPCLEFKDRERGLQQVKFQFTAEGRKPGEQRWLAHANFPAEGELKFRIKLGAGQYDPPGPDRFYSTSLRVLIVQDGQIYSYLPAPKVSPPRVIKIPAFIGTLPTRPLYIYLPRGYDEHTHRHYPVIYMHDGQNVFETYIEDSYAGSWKADMTANRLIAQGNMRECLIVGVANGSRSRIAEYLPPYMTLFTRGRRSPRKDFPTQAESKEVQLRNRPRPVYGRAHRTVTYYQNEVQRYVLQHFRVLSGRENTATVGSSMGGLFSAYIAWDHPEFARHHAIMSPSFWITRNQEGALEMIEHFRHGERRDVRLWLDSGTYNDGERDTRAARDALLENGYVEGVDFEYYLDRGAGHNEGAWGRRLSKVFQFLFPAE